MSEQGVRALERVSWWIGVKGCIPAWAMPVALLRWSLSISFDMTASVTPTPQQGILFPAASKDTGY